MKVCVDWRKAKGRVAHLFNGDRCRETFVALCGYNTERTVAVAGVWSDYEWGEWSSGLTLPFNVCAKCVSLAKKDT